MIGPGQIGHVHMVRRIRKLQQGPWAYGKEPLTYILLPVFCCPFKIGHLCQGQAFWGIQNYRLESFSCVGSIL